MPAKPRTPLVVCADDYALTPGVSRAIRELIAAKGVRCEGAWFFAGDRAIGATLANIRAEHAVFELSR